MVTIKQEIKTSGNSLMKNKLCEVVIKPSRGGKIRIFSKGADVSFDADIENLYSTDHCVTLCSKEHRTLLGDYKYKAMLCEHFMAACAICKIPYVANITGLGTAVENGGLMQKLTVFLYRIGLGKAKTIFFQNSENKAFFAI